MNSLYPLKFTPLYKERIWGGNKLASLLQKNTGMDNCGESWELSAVQDNVSIVSEGWLKGNTLQDLVETYMGDLVGDAVYDKFGDEFPLLIKFIDAREDLSIQVHPDDTLAKERHNAYGKTEMWYVMQADEGAELISGFNREINKDVYLEHLQNKTLKSILNSVPVKPGDAFFIPAGRVHAIGAGILLAEIQQTSDITYRIYDWDRVDSNGQSRELHTEMALDAIDYKYYTDYKTNATPRKNDTSNVVKSDFFVTNLIELDKPMEKDYMDLDTFVIFICLDGEVDIVVEGTPTTARAGETVLVPAFIKQLVLQPKGKSSLLEVYLPEND
jgi:mannose-6-phosphate isomerase